MSLRQFERIPTLIFDVHPNGRQQIRSALVDVGFRDVRTAVSFAEFAAAVSQRQWSLIIAEAFPPDGDTCALVRRLRAGDVGDNALSAIILTSWKASAELVSKIVNAGADDVMLRPFPQGRVAERVRYLSTLERSFVVTADYVGPERRRSLQRPGHSAKLVPAPNPLKPSAGQDDARKVMRDAAKAAIATEQVRRLAMRVATCARLCGVGGADIDIEIAALDRSARTLKRKLRALEAGETALSKAGDLTTVTETLVRLRRPSADALILARRLAFDALEHFTTSDEAATAGAEADDIAARIMARRAHDAMPAA